MGKVWKISGKNVKKISQEKWERNEETKCGENEKNQRVERI